MIKSTKSFVKGMGQAIDIGGTLTHRSASTGKYAIGSDWKAVGRDIKKALDKAGVTKSVSPTPSKKKGR